MVVNMTDMLDGTICPYCNGTCITYRYLTPRNTICVDTCPHCAGKYTKPNECAFAYEERMIDAKTNTDTKDQNYG